MKIKHKVQRNLDPTFQAELNHCSLCGLTQLVAVSGLCGVWGLAMALIVRCTYAWEMDMWGQRRGGRQHFWPPVGSAVLLPETRR